MTGALTEIFVNKLGNGKVIKLENHRRDMVGAVYPNLVDINKMVVLELDERLLDRYYIIISGLAVFFSYYRFE